MNEQSLDNYWHALDAQEMLRRLEVSADGLSDAQARQRFAPIAVNRLS